MNLNRKLVYQFFMLNPSEKKSIAKVLNLGEYDFNLSDIDNNKKRLIKAKEQGKLDELQKLMDNQI